VLQNIHSHHVWMVVENKANWFQFTNSVGEKGDIESSHENNSQHHKLCSSRYRKANWKCEEEALSYVQHNVSRKRTLAIVGFRSQESTTNIYNCMNSDHEKDANDDRNQPLCNERSVLIDNKEENEPNQRVNRFGRLPRVVVVVVVVGKKMVWHVQVLFDK